MRHLLIAIMAILISSTASGQDAPAGKAGRPGDIQGPVRAVFRLKATDETPQISDEVVASVKRMLTDRARALGVADPVVRSEGRDLTVELPELDDLDGALRYLNAQALLEFRYVQDLRSMRNPVAKIDWEVVRDEETGGEKIVFTDNLTGKEMTHKEVLQNSELVVSAKDLDASGIRADLRMAQPIVHIAFNKEGGRKFADFTRQHIDDVLPIVLDGEIISVPGIRAAITEGRAEIAGGFASVREAELLAEQLRAGAYPVPLQLVRVEEIEEKPGVCLSGL